MGAALRNRHHRCAVIPVVAALLAASLITGAAAQQQGVVNLRRIEGEFRLDGEMRDEQSSNVGGSTSDEFEWLLRENVGLRLLGDIMDPRILDLDLGLDFGLEQRRIDARDRPKRASDDTNFFYNARALFLAEGSVTAGVYTWRNRIETRQRFFETSRADIEEVGANIRLQDLFIPTQIHYDVFRYRGEGIDTIREGRERFRIGGARTSPWTNVNYEYALNDIDLISFDTEYEETVARASGTLRMGSNGKDFVRASGYFRDQTGDIDTEFAQGSGTLHLQWLDKLHSEHGVTVDQSEVNGATELSLDRVEVNTAIQHRLYESLDTRIEGRVTETDLGDPEIKRVQLGGDLDYQRKTPFGILGLTYRPGVYVQDETGSDEQTLVLDETHVFTPGVPIVLRNSAVDTTSVFVTNATGGTIYFEPVDYVAVLAGTRIRLDIPVGSSILAGSTILVDYAFQALPERKFRSVRHEVRARILVHNCANLELVYGTERQKLLSGHDSGTLDDTRQKAAHLRVFQWGQEVGADYEDRDSAFTPYERVQVHAISRHEFTRDVRSWVQARAYRTRFKGSTSKERGMSLASTLDWTLGPPSSVFLRGEYRRTDLEVDQGDGWMLEAGVNYHVRSTQLAVTARYLEEDFERASDQRLFFATITFKRFF